MQYEPSHVRADSRYVLAHMRARLTSVTAGNKHTDVPAKPFAYASLQGFIAKLLLDQRLESAMAEASNKVSGSVARPASGDAVLYDILDGLAFSTILAADRKSAFFAKGPNDKTLKLIFSLSVDWFGPRGLTKRNHSSVGVLSIVCLNLPPELRFAPENMHLVGITPGPREKHIQPFLAPLVDELLTLWKGIHFLTTALHRDSGRFVQAVLGPVVCDMQAARKVAGFVPARATWGCPYCKCKYEDMSNEDVINGHCQPRTRQEWLELAEQYRILPTKKQRADHKTAHGISWSELLRLPYWDPTRCLVVDAMHALFLGVLKFHIRRVWGIEEAAKKAKARLATAQRQVRLPAKVQPRPRKVAQQVTLKDVTSGKCLSRNALSAN